MRPAAVLAALLLASACAAPRARVAVAVPGASASVEAGAAPGAPIPKSVLPHRGKTSARAHGLGAFSDFAP